MKFKVCELLEAILQNKILDPYTERCQYRAALTSSLTWNVVIIDAVRNLESTEVRMAL
jgi:hypothetical protein